MNATPRLVYNLANVTFSFSHRWEEALVVLSVEGERLSCVNTENTVFVVLKFSFAGVDFFVGAHLAELLRRETFNLYTSLKRRNIGTHQVDQRLLNWMVRHKLIIPGTTSVTLVNVDDVEAFVDDCWLQNKERQEKRARTKRDREDDKPKENQIAEETEKVSDGVPEALPEAQFIYCELFIALLEENEN